jgi:ABC-2 type transport system permease protein
VKAMRSKLNYLIHVSLKRKIATKWFLIANIVLLSVAVALANVDTIIQAFGGDFNEKQQIYVIDNSKKTIDIFTDSLDQIQKTIGSALNYEITLYEKDEEELIKEMKENKKIWGIVFDSDDKLVINAKIITDSYLSAIDNQVLVTSINTTRTSLALLETTISEEDLNKILSQTEITREYLDETKKSEEENMEMIMSTVFPIIILPFFMLTIFLIQMIGAEVNDEKTTRGMEIIISNVSPKTHFFSKVIAGNLFVLIQGSLLFIYGLIGYFIRTLSGSSTLDGEVGKVVKNTLDAVSNSSIGDALLYVVPLTLLLMILTFIAYSLLAGILASMSTNIEDFQQVQTPIIVVSLIGYYLAMLSGLFKGSLLIRLVSYIPFISAILSPSLLIMGQIGLIDIFISLILMVLTIHLLIKYGLKIYKVGILNYSSSGLFKKMFKALVD